MTAAKLAAKLPEILPRAMAGDPAAIAVLALSGVIIGIEYLKK